MKANLVTTLVVLACSPLACSSNSASRNSGPADIMALTTENQRSTASTSTGRDAQPMGLERSRSAARTAMDQSSTSQMDTDLTRRVRQSLVNDRGLSTRAKNITILSENGNVTLKGAVATNQEKARVEEIAEKVSGAKSIDNQTEVINY